MSFGIFGGTAALFHDALLLLIVLVAGAWWLTAVTHAVMIRRLPDLTDTAYDSPAEASLGVVVPARNEQAAIASCIRSLISSDYGPLQVIAVDDRSTDSTGELLREISKEVDNSSRLRLIAVNDLPPDWLGKTHAMGLAADATSSEWLLFTDADVLFARETLRRAIVFAEKVKADHVVLLPTLITETFGEKLMIGFLLTLGSFSRRTRFWKVSDPRARDAVGIGAFNLVRRSVYRSIGGFAAIRMHVIEDLELGVRIKRAGWAQHCVLGPDLIRIHWAAGLRGTVNNLEKNLFAALGFRPERVLGATLSLAVMFLLPTVLICLSRGVTQVVAIAAVLAIAVSYFDNSTRTGISPAFFLLSPIATVVFVFTMLRGVILTYQQGGIRWRGTLYSLKELREHSASRL